MNAFGSPQAISPRVASTLHTHGHTRVLDATHHSARTYAITPKGITAPHAVPSGLPKQLTLIFDGKDRSTPTQLHLDRQPLPKRFWSYDNQRGVLSWSHNRGGTQLGGQMTVLHGGALLKGSLTQEKAAVSADATLAPITYLCDVAENTGASASGVAPALQLTWNTSDPKWAAANWVQGALEITVQITGQTIVGQPTYNIVASFADPQTSMSWQPSTGSMVALLSADLGFTFILGEGYEPATDDRSSLPAPANGIPTVFPYQMSYQLTNSSMSLAGALLTVNDSQAGTILGVRGTYRNPAVTGLYALNDGSGAARPMAVYNGTLHIQDQAVASSALKGSTLHFSGLTAEQQAATGLPAEGSLDFSPDGRTVAHTGGSITGSRITVEQAATSFAAQDVAHPAVAVAAALTTGSSLTLETLANMTQFTFQNSVWSDAVQTATMSDFNDILLYYMDPTLRQTYYNTDQPTLPSWLQTIAAMGDNPQQWYQSLSTAFLTNVMSQWNETGANQLNATRAQNWLKSQTAISPVFQTQSTAIYGSEWVNQPQNATLPQYLQDQKANQATYSPLIAQDAQSWIASLQTTLVDQTSIADMTQMITELATLATQAGLYWAYTYFRYITNPAALATIQMLSLGSATDLDGSAFMRQVQTNVALLSLLDSTNTFSQQYVEVIQIMQFGNMLPTLLDYSGNSSDYVYAVQQVLAQIAKQYQSSSDPQIAQAASQAQQLAQNQELASIITAMQASVAGTVGVFNWDQIASKMVQSVGTKIANFGAQLLCGVLSAVGAAAVVYGTLSWSQLGTAQQVQIATSGAVLAVQALSSVIKRGVAINAIWDSSVTTWDNLKSIFKLSFGKGVLSEAQTRMQSGFGRWLVGKTETKVTAEVEASLMTSEAEADAGFVTKIFGRNMTEFMATRIASLVSVVNLVVSIINLANSTSGLESWGNGLMAASALLDTLASIGGWALGGGELLGVSVATICSVLSFLAILAAIAGVIVLIILARKPQPNPVQQFGTDYAAPAGFFMPYSTEIDYFNGYVNGTEASRLGLTFSIPGQSSQLLKVGTGGAVSAGSVDYNYDTVFFPNTDGLGQTTVQASVSDGQGGYTTMLLTDNGNGTVSFQAPPAAGSTIPNTQLWKIVLQAAATMDGSFPSSGSFSITGVQSNQSLAWSNGSLVLSANGVNWTITQSPIALAGITMQPITLYTFSAGQTFTPNVAQVGSQPQVWSISPSLPSFLTFSTGSGAVSIASGSTSLPVTPQSSYTLSGIINGVMAQAVSASFTIQVETFSY